jgi:hypothetical protein
VRVILAKLTVDADTIQLADSLLVSSQAQQDTSVKSLSQAFVAAAHKATANFKRLYMDQANLRLRLHKLLEFKNGSNDKLPKSLLPKSQLATPSVNSGNPNVLEFRYKLAREQLDNTIVHVKATLDDYERQLLAATPSFPGAIMEHALWHRLRALHIQNCHTHTHGQVIMLQVHELAIKYLGAIALAVKLLSTYAAAAAEMLANKLRAFEDKIARNRDFQAAADMTSTEDLIKTAVDKAVRKALAGNTNTNASSSSSKNEARRGRQQSRPRQANFRGNNNNNNGSKRRANNNSNSRRNASASATSPRRSNNSTSRARSNRRPPSAPRSGQRPRNATPSRNNAANAPRRNSAVVNSNTNGRGSRTSQQRSGNNRPVGQQPQRSPGRQPPRQQQQQRRRGPGRD